MRPCLLTLLMMLLSVASGFAPSSVGIRASENQFRRAPGVSSWRRSSVLLMKQTSKQQQQQQEEELLVSSTLHSHTFDLEFPSFRELMLLSPGDFVTCNQTMDVMDETTNTTHKFQLLLYPRGGGHSSKTKTSDSGFGMAYRLFGDETEKVGLYLQYLCNDEDATSVDATFSLQLVGNQTSGRKFNVEWSSGMRFCTPEKSNLAQGMANDFGAHVMQTNLLPEFLGIDDTKHDEKVKAKVRITVHPRIQQNEADIESTRSSSNTGLWQTIDLPLNDIRTCKHDSSRHDIEQVRVGKVVVPVLTKLEQRPRMFELGAYPGVEYRIMQIFTKHGTQVFASEPGADYVMRPIYPLVAQLERAWPIRIPEEEIPKLLTPTMYNVISAIGSLVTAVGGLLTAFIISQAISLYVIPSKSMDPTLQVKNVLLVEKVSPRIFGATTKQHVGDVVLFSPPTRLQQIVKSSGGRIADRDLFVKRFAAGPGDIVRIEKSGAVTINGVAPRENRDLCGAEPLRLIEQYIQPTSVTVGDDEVFVLGDCSSVSVDSRVWGPLPSKDIVGKPLVRIWPLERFGAVPSLPMRNADWSD